MIFVFIIVVTDYVNVGARVRDDDDVRRIRRV